MEQNMGDFLANLKTSEHFTDTTLTFCENGVLCCIKRKEVRFYD